MTPRVRQYAEEIGFWHDVPAADIFSRSRIPRTCLARGDLMRRLRSEGFATTQIGRWLKRDHSTVIHWTRCAQPCGQRWNNDPRYPQASALDRLNIGGA